MWRQMLALLVLILITIVAVPARAAPLPRASPLSLAVTLDRDSYILGEPILFTWSITNEGKDPVWISPVVLNNIHLDLATRDGEKRPLRLSAVACTRPITLLLKPGCSRRDAIWLQGDYEGFDVVGDYKLSASTHSVFVSERDPPSELKEVVLQHDPIPFKVVKPTGASADTVALIAGAAKAPEDRLERGVGWFMGRPERRREVLEATRCPRFKAAASFHVAWWAYLDAPGRSAAAEDGQRLPEDGEKKLKEAAGLFAEVTKSEGSSKHLKALALYHLMLCKHALAQGADQKEVEELAMKIATDYPKTVFAEDAADFLKGLDAAKERK
jgi:hypothetical protein